MLQITIQDNNTNEVIYDREVTAIALQAVDREKVTRLKRVTEDAEPDDVILLIEAMSRTSAEVKKYLAHAVEKALDKGDDE